MDAEKRQYEILPVVGVDEDGTVDKGVGLVHCHGFTFRNVCSGAVFLLN